MRTKEGKMIQERHVPCHICHDTQPFVELTAEVLYDHCIVIVPRDYVHVNFEYVQQLFEHAKELAVLVDDNGVEKAKPKLNFHNRRGEGCCIRTVPGRQM